MLYGEAVGKRIKKGVILTLKGELGSGKTTFVKGLARGLGLKGKIKSPSFVIFYTHAIPKSKLRFYHFDLYRIERARELIELGFPEIIKNKNNITIIEWPEKAKKYLPKNSRHLIFTHVKKHPHSRIIKSS